VGVIGRLSTYRFLSNFSLFNLTITQKIFFPIDRLFYRNFRQIIFANWKSIIQAHKRYLARRKLSCMGFEIYKLEVGGDASGGWAFVKLCCLWTGYFSYYLQNGFS